MQHTTTSTHSTQVIDYLVAATKAANAPYERGLLEQGIAMFETMSPDWYADKFFRGASQGEVPEIDANTRAEWVRLLAAFHLNVERLANLVQCEREQVCALLYREAAKESMAPMQYIVRFAASARLARKAVFLP